MKRYLILSAVVTGFFYFPLAGYQSGPAANGEGNRTTSGTNATCSGVGCHGSNNSNTVISLTLMEGANPVTDGQYTPNTMYSVMLTAANTVDQPAAYGFQLAATKSDQTQAGTFAATGTLHTSTANTGGLTVVEHNAAIAATAGTATSPAFSWLSPPAGSGPVTFHAIMNAVNGNNFSDAGDHASTDTFALTENTLSVSESGIDLNSRIFPNPATDMFELTLPALPQNDLVKITVIDMVGKQVFSTVISDNRTVVNASNWGKGNFVVHISYGKTQHATLLVVR